jgi:hypothetical protein
MQRQIALLDARLRLILGASRRLRAWRRQGSCRCRPLPKLSRFDQLAATRSGPRARGRESADYVNVDFLALRGRGAKHRCASLMAKATRFRCWKTVVFSERSMARWPARSQRAHPRSTDAQCARVARGSFPAAPGLCLVGGPAHWGAAAECGNSLTEWRRGCADGARSCRRA